ncbi:CHC2 zinc finger domain-containing protein [Mycoplasmoides gallisepticum]|nr:CHC2 zinc finger domain-containing protein [Mycoplasmoides gallisepticum]
MSNDLNQLAKYLRKKISVSSIISKYLDLEKKGSNYKSLCPFHDDNTPLLVLMTLNRFESVLVVMKVVGWLNLFKKKKTLILLKQLKRS